VTCTITAKETIMTNLDPQTTGDFWDAYLRAAGAGANLSQVSHIYPDAPAAITFAWDLVVLRRPIAAGAPPKAA
jgi:hypothetical protein